MRTLALLGMIALPSAISACTGDGTSPVEQASTRTQVAVASPAPSPTVDNDRLEIQYLIASQEWLEKDLLAILDRLQLVTTASGQTGRTTKLR